MAFDYSPSHKDISDAAVAALADPKIAYPGLLYGPDAGHPPLRSAVAKWLTDFYQPSEPIPTDRITITGGASQNLACLLQVFTDPLYTKNVFIVAPAYMLAFRTFVDNGFGEKMRAVPEDEDAIDLDSLRRQLEKSESSMKQEGNTEARTKPPRPWAKHYRHVIYCVPTFANPSSRTMSLDRRRSLVQLAREFDALIIADDVYDQLQWPVDPPAAGAASLSKAYLPRLSDIDRTIDGGAERKAQMALAMP
ncbi:Valine--pyruvate aminotransferase [Taxawa tesnikishii (nom. ined.)]|nr:Valine--pyruvate aminotransferase [Dothideales sp. JES 119]